MELHLIDFPDQWDAVQLVNVAMTQIWDELLVASCPDLDSRRDVIPDQYVNLVFDSPA